MPGLKYEWNLGEEGGAGEGVDLGIGVGLLIRYSSRKMGTTKT